ncbi:MAG: YjbH domain-containing protein, partial [Halomonas sp.]|nr:YjbH domain-containing protein [Halomonas sp.]
YVGGRGDIDNPLGYLDDRFDSRPEDGGGDRGGEFAFNQLFRGPVALFGGVEYQTPWEPLSLQLEYEGNDYQNEPLNNVFEQDSPFNVGARYALNDNLAFRLGWERGNTLMAGVTISLNLAEIAQPKRDPAPVPLADEPTSDAQSWLPIAVALQNNAGVHANRISIDGDELLIEAEPTKYRSLLESEVRANRILHNNVSPRIDTFRYRWQNLGLNLREDVHSREAFVAAAQSSTDEMEYQYGIYATAATQPVDEAPEGKTVYASDPSHFSWSVAPGYNQNLGGPDGYLYQVYAKLNGAYRTDANGWFSGQLAWNLYDNLDNYEYIAESDLPRVRTYIGEYLSETNVGIYNLQYTRTARLADDWYGMAYGGILEMMYAGVGGEVLYRPFDSAVAFGLDLNWVKQRDFDQLFGLRDYDTWTGHATAYVETGIEDVLAQVSVGRYLAKDIGMSFTLSREFDSGVHLGAWATFTDAGDAYGEGSFDKGLYVAIPFDVFFTSSSRSYTTVSWQPLTRDGGARLARRYSLYGITQDSDIGSYWNYFDEALE